MEKSTVVWLVLIVLVGVGVWITASQVLAIIWGVLILVAALAITGVFGSLFGKKVVKNPETGLPASWDNAGGREND